MSLLKYAVIVAGGAGTRMENSIPKQFLQINGHAIIYYTVKSFLDTFPDLKIIVLLPNAYLSEAQTIFQGLDLDRIQFVEGGATRFHSVKNGLQYVPKDAIVWVHDGVRCMVSSDLIRTCYDEALEYGNAIPAVNATDSIRFLEGSGNKSVDREKVFIIQTPQTFQSNILLKAFEKEYSPLFTDEASVVEADGVAIHLVNGDHHNIKVTRPIDLVMVEHWMSKA